MLTCFVSSTASDDSDVDTLLTLDKNEESSIAAAREVRLVGDEIIPLANFQPNDTRFQNACFIAAVVNLRNLIPEIARVLELQNLTWKEAIKVVRAKWQANIPTPKNTVGNMMLLNCWETFSTMLRSIGSL